MRKKIVLNIGGIDWGRSKWNYLTRKFIQLCEILCVKFSDVVITDNKYIQELYKERYNAKSVLIEYGGDHVLDTNVTQEALRKYPFIDKDYVLTVSRAQSDNNIHMLLAAFEKMPEKMLVIVSNWDKSEYGCELKTRYCDKYPNIKLLNAIYEQEELDIIRKNASLYIHSHSFCGTAPSLVEAMNLGLPIICYDAQTNIETTENKSIYFSSEDELIEIVEGITAQTLSKLRTELKEIADRRYQWRIIADKYASCLNGSISETY